ncbi:hypothetical protein AAMO2058_000877800 [Amorphochlora amoebiformis]
MAGSDERCNLLDGLKSVFFVCLYICSSITLIFFNKFLLTTTFPHPVLLTLWHMCIAFVLTQVMTCIPFLRHLVKSEKSLDCKQYLMRVFPIGLLFSISLSLGNWAYMYLSVAFIQMLKANQLLIMIILSFFVGIIKPSWTLFLIVCIIVAGICATVVGELHFDAIGVAIQSGGILAEGSRLILVNLLLSSKGIKLKPLQALYYFAPACGICLGVYWLAYEAWRMPWDDITKTGFLMLSANGLMSFVLNCASVLVIGHANAMVLSLAGVVKDIMIVSGSCIIFGTIVTSLQIGGYAVALAGVFAYKLYTSKALRSAFAEVLHLNSNPITLKVDDSEVTKPFIDSEVNRGKQQFIDSDNHRHKHRQQPTTETSLITSKPPINNQSKSKKVRFVDSEP